LKRGKAKQSTELVGVLQDAARGQPVAKPEGHNFNPAYATNLIDYID